VNAFVLGLSLTLVSNAACAITTPTTEEDPVKGQNVVLLHGLGRSSANMLILKWRLQARGYEVCNVGYETRIDSIEAASDRVFASLTDCVDPQQPTHFVTHSLGGLVLRSLLARHAVDRTGRAVMLAPPNRGSEIADWIRTFPISTGLMGRLAGQLGTRSDDLPQDLPIPSIAFGVIAGDRWINPVGPWLLPSPHDGTVSVASTRLEGMSDHLVLPHTHTFIVNSAEVADQVDSFLRNGRFRRSEASPSRKR
jgi:pimeloyl-ACP methyl ester carboxylesterase